MTSIDFIKAIRTYQKENNKDWSLKYCKGVYDLMKWQKIKDES